MLDLAMNKFECQDKALIIIWLVGKRNRRILSRKPDQQEKMGHLLEFVGLMFKCYSDSLGEK